nr:eukaryotic translation initiation factor 3 subunit J-A-like [Cherax quadricarinatus]
MSDVEWDADDFEPPKVAPALPTDKWDGEDEEDDIKDNWDDEEEERKEATIDTTTAQVKKKKKKLSEIIAEKEASHSFTIIGLIFIIHLLVLMFRYRACRISSSHLNSLCP